MKNLKVIGCVWIATQLVACGAQHEPSYQASQSTQASSVKSSDQTPSPVAASEKTAAPDQKKAMSQAALVQVQQRLVEGGGTSKNKLAALADVANSDKTKQVLDQACKPEGVKEIVIDQAKLDAIQKAAEDGDFDALQKAIDAFFADIQKQFDDLLADIQAQIPDAAKLDPNMNFEEMQKQIAQNQKVLK